MSIGLLADASAGWRIMVFASPSGQFYRDVTTPYLLSGLTHLDNFIVTHKSCPLTGTLQKRIPTPTQTATPYTTGPLANIPNISHSLKMKKLHKMYFARSLTFSRLYLT
jgi:hypothetical protein